MSGFSVFHQVMPARALRLAGVVLPVSKRRRAVGLSLPRLAELAGVCRATVCRLEAGYALKASTVAKIVGALDQAERVAA